MRISKYLWRLLIVKLQHISGIERGFLSPTFTFPMSRLLQRSMNSSPIPSARLGSSRLNGSVDLQHLSVHTISDVLLVFMRWPASCWPHMDSAHLTAVDLPKRNVQDKILMFKHCGGYMHCWIIRITLRCACTGQSCIFASALDRWTPYLFAVACLTVLA